MEWDITIVTVPPPRTEPVIIVASRAVSTAATCWLLAWAWLSWSRMPPLLTPNTTAAATAAAAATAPAAMTSRLRGLGRPGQVRRGQVRRGQVRRDQVRRAGSGSGPGGRCLVAAAAAITRALSAGGGLK